MDFESPHEFIVDGEALREGTLSVPVTIRGSYQSLGPSPMQCTVLPRTESLPPGFGDPLNYLRPIYLKGTTSQHKEIWIPDFRVDSVMVSKPQSWEGTATLFMEGSLGEIDTSQGFITCTAYIPRTPIAESLARFGSEPELMGEERRSIPWDTALGEARLLYMPSKHFSQEVGLDRAWISMWRCQVSISVEAGKFRSLGEMLASLEDGLEDSLWLLSFLSRKRIDWYEASAGFIPTEDSEGPGYSAIARRAPWLGYQSRTESSTPWENALIWGEGLEQGDLFQHLLANYEGSPFRKTIKQAIGLLLTSYERGYFESHLGCAYSALESLISALGEAAQVTYLINRSPFDRLSKKLRQVIRDEIDDDDIARGIIATLPGLRRRVYRERILVVLEYLGIELTDWWAPWDDIATQLQEIIRRRDVYIHQGHIDDPYLYRFDLQRLQTLIELIILRLLDCPDSAINSFAQRRSKDELYNPGL